MNKLKKTYIITESQFKKLISEQTDWSKFPCLETLEDIKVDGKDAKKGRGSSYEGFYFFPDGTAKIGLSPTIVKFECNEGKAENYCWGGEQDNCPSDSYTGPVIIIGEYYDTYQVKTNGGTLNVRKSPSVQAPVLSRFKNGGGFWGKLHDDNWIEVSIDNKNPYGYVSRKYTDWVPEKRTTLYVGTHPSVQARQ